MNQPHHGQDGLQRLYEHLLRDQTIDAAAAELGVSSAEVDAAVTHLLDLGLVRRRSGGHLAAVPPHDAAEHVLRPLEHEVRERHAEIEQVRDRLRDFVPVFEAGRPQVAERVPLQRLDTVDTVRAVVAELSERCTEHVLDAQPGNGATGAVLEEVTRHDEVSVRPGVRTRLLHQHSARFHPGSRAHLERMHHSGAEVRTVGDDFARLLVFDSSAALIEAPDDTGAAIVIRDRGVLSWMVHQHERLWQRADPYGGDIAEQPVAQDLQALVMRLLSEGLTDAAVARRLGISVRTCRRHVAEVMARLGSASRFQTGYHLAVRELARLPPPDGRGDSEGARDEAGS